MFLTHSKYSDDFRVKATFGVAVFAVLVLTPFAINSFFQDRAIIGFGLAVIITFLSVVAWTIHFGNYTDKLIFFCLVPCTIFFLGVGINKMGILGALWCFPTVVAYYFTLPEKKALTSNLLFLIILLPLSWFILQPALSLRLSATLIAVSALSYIFLRMILSQQARIQNNEQLRREGMASVSHELRTPLATAITRVDAMLDNIRPTDTNQLQSLSRSLIHLSKIVDDLYELALADVGALVLHKKRVKMDEIIVEALEAAQDKFAERQLTLTSDIAENLQVYGDPKLLRQILDNLLENCYRYTSAAGTVKVRLYQDKGLANLVVRDSGPGVDDNTRLALFERFHRADTSRSRDTGGSGLGLALVKAMTEAHGGQVEAFKADEGGLGIRIKLRVERPSSIS